METKSMKSAKEKAEYWLDMNVSGYTKQQVTSLETLLKHQDRDTRHACADAVIDADDPHVACMNARAV